MTEPITRRDARFGSGASGKKRLYIYGGAALLVVGVVLYERKKSKSAPAATTDPNAYDPTQDPNYDPNAGYYTSNAGYGGGAVGVTPGSTDTTGTTGTGSTLGDITGQVGADFSAPTNNVTWTALAVTLLQNNGYDPVTSTVALGVFLSGGGLTQDQYNIVTAALALAGNPPTAVPAPHLVPSQGQTTKTKAYTLSQAHPFAQIPSALANAHVSRMTTASLAKYNPAVAVKYANSKTAVPAGTRLTVLDNY